MQRKIVDYLNFYIGQQHRYSYVETPDRFTIPVSMTLTRLSKLFDDTSIYTIQLLLRPLDSMTEEEARILHDVINQGDALDVWHDSYLDYFQYEEEHYLTNLDAMLPSQLGLPWLLRNGFDVFGLIECGLAIDKTKM